MTARIQEICSHIPKCKTFADVGCDHGYMAQYALRADLCERAYISDISKESLQKAITLLKNYVDCGRCIPICTDGLTRFPETPECVLIAGMGGEEAVKILREAPLPQTLLLQPMKNAEKVRAYLLSNGYRILSDYTFEDGKFYDFIVAARGEGDAYTKRELAFGRDNLSAPSPAFLKKIRKERDELRSVLDCASLSEENRAKVQVRMQALEEVLHEVAGNLS